MTFTITPNRLDNDARRAIWSKGFPTGMQTGFHVYFSDAKPDNICSLCLNNDWWQDDAIAYMPSTQIQDWIQENYPDLAEDMKCLAKFIFLTKDDSFHKRADYVTRLWEERGGKLLQLVYLEYIPQFLGEVLRGTGSREVIDTIGICWLSSEFPRNLPDGLSRLVEFGIENDMQGFTSWLNHSYGIAWAIDEFLGLLLRSFAGELDFEGNLSGNPDSDSPVSLCASEVGL